MSVRNEVDLEPDLELFAEPIGLLENPTDEIDASTHWKLAFGPNGESRPIWGLFRFDEDARHPIERVFLWRSNPTRAELLQWGARNVGEQLFTSLLDAVGDVDCFYEEYFAYRPDLKLISSGDPPMLSLLMIHAPTAVEVSSRTNESETLPSSTDEPFRLTLL